jgi:hypothetical protein
MRYLLIIIFVIIVLAIGGVFIGAALGPTDDQAPPETDRVEVIEAETDQGQSEHSQQVTDHLLIEVSEALDIERQRSSEWEERYHELVMEIVDDEERAVAWWWPWLVAWGSIGVAVIGVAVAAYLVLRRPRQIVVQELPGTRARPQIAWIDSDTITPPAPEQHELARRDVIIE